MAVRETAGSIEAVALDVGCVDAETGTLAESVASAEDVTEATAASGTVAVSEALSAVLVVETVPARASCAVVVRVGDEVSVVDETVPVRETAGSRLAVALDVGWTVAARATSA